MLRSSGVRSLGNADVPAARALCDSDPVANVFVAARLDEGALATGMGAGFTTAAPGVMTSMLWASANVVPVAVAEPDFQRYAARLRRGHQRFSSVFGPADQVLPLWQHVKRHFRPPSSFRPEQPLLVASRSRRLATGVLPDSRVRLARPAELDLVVPAAASMFTEEIGYRPFVGSDTVYRAAVRDLIQRERTFVLVDGGRVRFKADVGSLASGVAQIQGVWIDPAWRGRGLAAPCMARVVELVEGSLAGTVSLYVNDYNLPALRAYLHAGFERVGTFATVIM